jgi:hypothetical protein
MTSQMRIIAIFAVVTLLLSCGGSVAMADSNHARIVRLSLVQGDVRFIHDVKGDPLNDSRTGWEAAVLNLPIRQGYVLATDAGRAEVEFEDGATAFLAENTVLEFYDLSSEDGGFTTRLILRQGSAEFYVNPARGDYFSVTGGDFSVQAESKTMFRMNNFDDGSNVNVIRGRLTALVNGKETLLQKNQSLSLQAGQPESMAIERIPASDDFDQWVAGRIETATTATEAGRQYTNGYSGYSAGFGDLYTYGSWFPVAGFGNCWRPYGVGFGWSPFDVGSWYWDPVFGWTFIGGQLWGWLPYHFGGWLFRPGIGWVWSPSGSFGNGGVGRWRPVTGTWMKAGNSVGIVPSHPMDIKGKPPINLSQGVYAVTSRGVTGLAPEDGNTKWKVEGRPSRDVMQNQLAESSAPARLSRTMAAGATGGTREGGAGTSIVYDRTERKFVNLATAAEKTEAANSDAKSETPKLNANGVRIFPEQSRNQDASARMPVNSNRVNGRESATANVPTVRNSAPARTALPPPNVPRSVSNERVFNEGGRGAASGGGSSASGRASSGSMPSASSSAPRTSSGGTGSTGGGRPH